ncbi:MAG: peptidase [Candidatus Krumholzibacteriia bacterium]
MKRRQIMLLLVLACAWISLGASTLVWADDHELKVTADIEARRAQFTPYQLSAKLDHLSAGDKMALQHLVNAAHHIDAMFKVQAWKGNPEAAEKIARYDGPHAQAVKDYYRINYGFWDRLEDDFEPFIGDQIHPDGAGFYPEDMTKEEFEAWLEAHPGDREAFTSLHTMIRRDGGKLVAIPYSDFFETHLQQVAREMRAAADATTDATLAKFLRSRAEALFTDDYFQSDMDWMDLAGDLEIVIGPYETYEDQLFGYKASFETFICVVDPDDSAALAKYKSELPWLERNLPIPDEHKNLNRGTESPIRVADEVYTAGDTRAGVQTIAFNLPNDERVREIKGSKKVMLKNILRAKYEAILKPIATVVLAAGASDRVVFDAYFSEVLLHELAHGLGPGKIVRNGQETEVRLELKELYSTFEEAKADVVGAYNLYALADKGIVDEAVVKNLSWTMLAGFFRSARFGTGSAHGQGVVMQINYLLEYGAVEATEDGRFRPIAGKFRDGLKALSHDLLMIQALGDYDGAKAFLDKYGKVSAPMRRAFERLESIPVDVDPVYVLEG